VTAARSRSVAAWAAVLVVAKPGASSGVKNDRARNTPQWRRNHGGAAPKVNGKLPLMWDRPQHSAAVPESLKATDTTVSLTAAGGLTYRSSIKPAGIAK